VVPCSGHFQGAASGRLAPHLAQIVGRSRIGLPRRGDRAWKRGRTSEGVEELVDRSDGADVDPGDEGCLGAVPLRDDGACDSSSSSAEEVRQHAANGVDRARQGQLAEEQDVVE
jgi:hypothetical protein